MRSRQNGLASRNALASKRPPVKTLSRRIENALASKRPRVKKRAPVKTASRQNRPASKRSPVKTGSNGAARTPGALQERVTGAPKPHKGVARAGVALRSRLERPGGRLSHSAGDL